MLKKLESVVPLQKTPAGSMGVPGLSHRETIDDDDDVSSISVGWFSQINFILFESSNKKKRYFVSGLASTQLLYKYYTYFL